MKKLGTSLIALGFAAAIFATAPAEANDKTSSASRQDNEQSEGVTVTAPALPQVSGETEEQYDFSGAYAYYDEHPEGGG